ncbi:hypothetical protein QTI33_33185 [Variovorax sp. J22P271]|uniref:hypothetical protein n=1 Tax=Variovorax davisae TaxID=3053515 RepID=UPI0025758063|nr:hypothetical protein [Variovorax sp. J22P271]MDM0037030.1 hypothetical protein [Variovorax sp. J22P271]
MKARTTIEVTDVHPHIAGSPAKQLIFRSDDLELPSALALSCALRNPMDGAAAAMKGIQARASQRNPEVS